MLIFILRYYTDMIVVANPRELDLTTVTSSGSAQTIGGYSGGTQKTVAFPHNRGKYLRRLSSNSPVAYWYISQIA